MLKFTTSKLSNRTIVVSKPRVDKVWPAGQILPTDAGHPSHRVVNSTLASYFPRKNQTWSCYLLK